MAVILQIIIALLPILLKLLGIMKASPPGKFTGRPALQRHLGAVRQLCQQLDAEMGRVGIEVATPDNDPLVALANESPFPGINPDA